MTETFDLVVIGGDCLMTSAAHLEILSEQRAGAATSEQPAASLQIRCYEILSKVNKGR